MRATILSKNSALSRVIVRWLEDLGYDEVVERMGGQAQREGDLILLDEADPRNVSGAHAIEHPNVLTLSLSSTIRSWLSRNPKPFEIHRPLHETQFEINLTRAYQAHHEMKRPHVLWISDTAPVFQEKINQSWRLMHAKPADAVAAFSNLISGTAVVVVDPLATGIDRIANELRTWRRSPDQQSIFWVCLSRAPSLPANFRTLFNRYFDPSTLPDVSAAIESWVVRARMSFPIRLWSLQLKELLNKNQLRAALELTKKTVPTVQESWELLGLAASIESAAGDSQASWKTIEAALAINPFAPGLYSQALTLLDGKDPRLSRALSQAILYCPGLKSDLTSLNGAVSGAASGAAS